MARVIAIAGMPSLALGCVSYSALPLELKEPSQYAVHTDDKGVSAGGVLFGKAESEKFLGVDVTEHYIPVLLVVRNSSEDLMMIQRADITLTGGGDALHAFDWTAPFRLAKKQSGDAAVGFLSSDSAEKDTNIANDAMAYDWKRKQFPEQFSLKPERGVSGMVYFPAAAKPPLLVDLES